MYNSITEADVAVLNNTVHENRSNRRLKKESVSNARRKLQSLSMEVEHDVVSLPDFRTCFSTATVKKKGYIFEVALSYLMSFTYCSTETMFFGTGVLSLRHVVQTAFVLYRLTRDYVVQKQSSSFKFVRGEDCPRFEGIDLHDFFPTTYRVREVMTRGSAIAVKKRSAT